jgi:hypothetical protein
MFTPVAIAIDAKRVAAFVRADPLELGGLHASASASAIVGTGGGSSPESRLLPYAITGQAEAAWV